jgi:thiamine pyrophosphokinase
LTIRGVKYPLQDHRLEACDSLSVSNEIVEEEMEVRFRSGCLVVMETRD